MLRTEEFTLYKFNARYTKSQCVRLFTPETMQPSLSCRSLMKSYEKLFRMPYRDQNGKLITEYINGATIGYGHLIANKREFENYKDGITDTQANILFSKDIYEPVQAVRYNIKVKITQHEFDGLVMFAFNVGVSAFKKSSVLKIINNESSGNVKAAWYRFRYSQGTMSRGLINRRRAEMAVFFNGVYFKI